jgi:hypothetical protein
MTFTQLVPASAMTEREFGTVFAKLAMQLRWMDADELAIRSYYEPLKDAPFAAVKAAAETFAKEPGRRFFPTSAEWYQAAQQAAKEALRAAIPCGRDEPWRMDCAMCEDTGWEPFECSGDSLCGRKQKHAPHPYVRSCPCRASNRTYQRHQNFGSGE